MHTYCDRTRILTDWNLSNVLGNTGLASSNRHLNLRPGISSSTGRANTIGSDTVLRHSDSGNSWLPRTLRILRMGITDMSIEDDDTSRLFWNMGWAQSSLSVLLSTPESLEVMSAASRRPDRRPCLGVQDVWRRGTRVVSYNGGTIGSLAAGADDHRKYFHRTTILTKGNVVFFNHKTRNNSHPSRQNVCYCFHRVISSRVYHTFYTAKFV